MRLSVQIRVAGGVDGQRWRRSVYVDPTPRPTRLRVADLEPIVNQRSAPKPITTRVQSILIVIDTINAKPGSSGEVVLKDAAYGRAQ
jgi:hypothetical protein